MPWCFAFDEMEDFEPKHGMVRHWLCRVPGSAGRDGRGNSQSRNPLWWLEGAWSRSQTCPSCAGAGENRDQLPCLLSCRFALRYLVFRASLAAQLVKNLPVMQETWVLSLSWEDSLEEGMATHSSILAWRILMDRGAWQEPYSPWGRRVRHD